MEKVKYLFEGYVNDTLTFVLEKQLKEKSYWKKFVEVYATKEDLRDDGWRGEYFGKLMRGACMVYSVTGDEELYSVLTDTVCALLATQDEHGRFSTYPIESEFRGWDVWSRKYVLVGLQYYRGICKDEALRETILTAMQKHADYIVEKIGDKAGQTSILQTSDWWGGVASCSILEPIVEMYKLTGKESYLRFAEYILSTGGCDCDNLIEHALQQDKMPFEYGEVKAYETMSFFEGALAYYEVTGERKYLQAVQNFVENVHDTDISIIGCAGCTHELFDNSQQKQTEYSEIIMQETCVAVTWMRLLARLQAVTPQARYAEWIETSARNTLYGALNTKGLQQFSLEGKKYVAPLAFDSYSPLYNNKRGRGVGGYKEFLSGGHYGCCVAIAAAGIALYPMEAVKISSQRAVVDFFIDGKVERSTENGTISVETTTKNYDTVVLKVRSTTSGICLKVRIPSYAHNVTLNGKKLTPENGYATIENAEQAGELCLELHYEIVRERLNGKTAFTYGPYVLALDQAKGDWTDFTQAYAWDNVTFSAMPCEEGEQVRFLAKGERDFLFTDYASCGKDYFNNANISVWFNEK